MAAEPRATAADSEPSAPSTAPRSASGAAHPFALEDEPIDLAGTPPEAWLSLGLFWLLGLTVGYQFVTRYVFNDSAGWTEEIARYLLIATVFVGASVGVMRNNHIQVDFLYRYLPRRVGRALSLCVDAVRVSFFACLVVLMAQMMARIGDHSMTVVPLPMNVLYAVCELGFLAMTWRSAAVAWAHYRRGHSRLERPDAG
jgi:TRAP-type C4-dicarboxylate transport system permease small subunit